MLFNHTVCVSNDSARSVTKCIQIIKGRFSWGDKRRVNVIDTIGMCDTEMTATEVLEAAKQSVTIHQFRIDKVVMLMTGRIEGEQLKQARNFLKWLRYEKYPRNFAFVYTKADQIKTAGQRDHNLATMMHELAKDTSVTQVQTYRAKEAD